MAKKATKTNKTSHVLNLLTNGAEAEQSGTEEAKETTGRETLAESLGEQGNNEALPLGGGRGVSSAMGQSRASEGSKVTVIDEATENDRLSGEIMKSLEESLIEESISSSEESHKEEEEELIKEPIAADEYNVNDISEADADNTDEEEFHIVNVMDAILKQQDIPGFMAQYGCCTCKKCVADVTALALTKLPAKYVVLEKDVTSPMIGFYQSRYRAEILASLLRACLMVKESPRHDR